MYHQPLSAYLHDMGFIANQKASSIGSDAQAAWDEGSPFFAPLLNLPAFKSGFSGRVRDWEPMMYAITSVGWKLHTWAVCSDDRGKPQAMPLFVR
jgi:hypothetical protein